MLSDWNHRVFKDDSKYRSVGKITAVVVIYLRYAKGEESKDRSLTTVGELYPTGERQVRKVITGKLYDTEGKISYLHIISYLQQPEGISWWMGMLSGWGTEPDSE